MTQSPPSLPPLHVSSFLPPSLPSLPTRLIYTSNITFFFLFSLLLSHKSSLIVCDVYALPTTCTIFLRLHINVFRFPLHLIWLPFIPSRPHHFPLILHLPLVPLYPSRPRTRFPSSPPFHILFNCSSFSITLYSTSTQRPHSNPATTARRSLVFIASKHLCHPVYTQHRRHSRHV